jgi:hypothetical protein
VQTAAAVIADMEGVETTAVVPAAGGLATAAAFGAAGGGADRTDGSCKERGREDLGRWGSEHGGIDAPALKRVKLEAPAMMPARNLPVGPADLQGTCSPSAAAAGGAASGIDGNSHSSEQVTNRSLLNISGVLLLQKWRRMVNLNLDIPRLGTGKTFVGQVAGIYTLHGYVK